MTDRGADPITGKIAYAVFMWRAGLSPKSAPPVAVSTGMVRHDHDPTSIPS
jgi:hypothetical protein